MLAVVLALLAYGVPDNDASATGRGADAIEVRFTVFYQSGQGRFGAFCAADDTDDRPLVSAGQSPPVSRYEFAYDTVEDAVSITRASGGAEREVLAAVDYGNLPQLPSPGTGFNHVARCGPGGRLALLGPAGETLIAAVDSQPLRGEVAGLLATSGSDPAQPLRVDWQRVEVLSPTRLASPAKVESATGRGRSPGIVASRTCPMGGP